MRAADIADDIVVASTNWSRDGKLNHKRKDNFVDFDHGNTLIAAGNAKYSAEVIIGITNAGNAVFYDVVNMSPASFEMKKEESPTIATAQNARDDIHGDSSDANIARENTSVKYSSSNSNRNENSIEEVVRSEQGNKKRFSMADTVEETDKLIAVHNKSLSGLKRMLQRNGVPFPSIAIKKAGSGHEGFGEVSIVFPKSTIDPERNAWNRLYSNDAWTPTEPRTEYDVGHTYKYQKLFENMLGSDIYHALKGSSHLSSSELERKLESNNEKIQVRY